MFVFYASTTDGKQLAVELGAAYAIPRRNRLVAGRKSMSVVVNWGCGHRLLRSIDAQGRRILNRTVRTVSSKLAAFELLRAADLPVPKYAKNYDEVLPDDPRPFYMRGKYLARRDRMTRGNGIEVVECGEVPQESDYDFYSLVVSKRNEVRFHVLGGEIKCEQVKYIPAGSNVLIRSYRNGARFSAKSIDTIIDSSIANAGRDIAIRAVSACGLDFAAVDMALTRSGRWVIFELNSAPGISRRADEDHHDMVDSYTAYLEYFRQFII